jgi:hypothetical protein
MLFVPYLQDSDISPILNLNETIVESGHRSSIKKVLKELGQEIHSGCSIAKISSPVDTSIFQSKEDQQIMQKTCLLKLDLSASELWLQRNESILPDSRDIVTPSFKLKRGGPSA